MTDISDIQTNDFGELSVQLATVGDITGSDTEGKPVKQRFTEEAFQKIAADVNEAGEDIPVDKDHASMRPGLDRDTESMGWISRLWANAKGLFGWLKFTRKGRELVEDRAYRFLSPSFALDDNGVPVRLINAGMTNMPACRDNLPILNTVPNNKDILDMSKEELIELIKETVTALNAAPAEQKTEEVATSTEAPVDDVANNAKPKEGCCECGDDEKKEETVVSETPDEEEKPDEGKTTEEKEVVEETVETKEEVVEEKTEEKSDDEDDEKKERKTKLEKEEPEVIKIEALNSRPVTLEAVGKGTGADWRNLHGKEFFDYLSKHKAEMVDECRY